MRLFGLVEDGNTVIPSEENANALIEWVHRHDMYQVPDISTDVLAEWGETNPGEVPDDIRLLPWTLILQLRANPNISLGNGYRRYPGFSAAQVRKGLGVGW